MNIKSFNNSYRNKISAITFICSIMIIYIHAFNLDVYGINTGPVYVVEKVIKSVCENAVPIFFFISGFLFFRDFKIDNLTQKWRKRFYSILIPYLIWCILYYVYLVISTNIIAPYSALNIQVKELSFAGLINSIWLESYYTLWFLKNLIIFILFAPLEYFLLKNYKPRIYTGIVSLLICYVIVTFIINSIYVDGLFMYLCGSYIGINNFNIVELHSKKTSMLSIIVLPIFLIINYLFKTNINSLIILIVFWYFIDLFNLDMISNKWWIKNTFFTYVSHDMILEPLEGVFLLMFGVSQTYAIIDYLLMPIVTFLLVTAVSWILRNKAKAIYNLLSGWRN